MDRLTSMETFVKVVESGSFVAAARKLGMSPAMVTRHVVELETRLHMRLLERTTRSLRLTDAGTGYLERCQQILRDIEETEAAVAGEMQRPRGILRVSSSGSFGVLRLSPLLSEYLMQYPDVTLDVSISNRNVDLVTEGIDVALRIGVMTDSNLVARKLCPVRLVLCASPEYLARHGRPGTTGDLARHNCLAFTLARDGREWWFRGPEGVIAVPIQGTLRSDETYVLYRAALDGLGIIYSTTYQVEYAVKAGKLEVIQLDYPSAEVGAYAVFLSRKFLSAKIRTFVDFLARKLGQDPDWDLWMMQPAAKRRARE
ncbi:MAG: LysR family transcriptional regulator [Burkholderiales bacterium]